MRITLSLLLFAASLAAQQPAPAAPTSATDGERAEIAQKDAEQYSAEIDFQRAEIEALKAEIAKYEELLAGRAVRANKEGREIFERLQKAHNAAGCDLRADGSWEKCPPPPPAKPGNPAK